MPSFRPTPMKSMAVCPENQQIEERRCRREPGTQRIERAVEQAIPRQAQRQQEHGRKRVPLGSEEPQGTDCEQAECTGRDHGETYGHEPADAGHAAWARPVIRRKPRRRRPIQAWRAQCRSGWPVDTPARRTTAVPAGRRPGAAVSLSCDQCQAIWGCRRDAGPRLSQSGCEKTSKCLTLRKLRDRDREPMNPSRMFAQYPRMAGGRTS
jgi:hypothetical protein